MLAPATPEPILAATPGVAGDAQPPPAKRRFGKLELAIVLFLAFDVLVLGAWKLFGGNEPSEEVATLEPEDPQTSPAPEERPSAPAAEADPVSVPPGEARGEASDGASGQAKSVDEAIAAALPPEPTSSGPVRSLSRTLSESEFRETMVEARDKIVASCLDSRMRRTLKVSLKVDPSGEVTFARVIGGLSDTKLGRCVVKQTYRMDFPASLEGGSHVYTLRLR